MKQAQFIGLTFFASAFALLAACASDGEEAPAPVVVEAPTTRLVQETETDDLKTEIVIAAEARMLPGVGERLIARAEAEAATVARRAGERRRESPAGGFTPSEFHVAWSVAWQDSDAVSLLGRTRTFEGGFGAEETRETLLFDRAAGRELGFGDLFADPRADGPAMRAVSEAAFASWAEVSPTVDGANLEFIDERTLVDARESLRPRVSSFETFTFVPSPGQPSRIEGVQLLYPPGVLGPRTDGPFTLFVPAAVLREHLAPDWAVRLASDVE